MQGYVLVVSPVHKPFSRKSDYSVLLPTERGLGGLILLSALPQLLSASYSIMANEPNFASSRQQLIIRNKTRS